MSQFELFYLVGAAAAFAVFAVALAVARITSAARPEGR